MSRKFKKEIIDAINKDNVLTKRNFSVIGFDKQKKGGHMKLRYIFNGVKKTINVSSTPSADLSKLCGIIVSHLRRKTIDKN